MLKSWLLGGLSIVISGAFAQTNTIDLKVLEPKITVEVSNLARVSYEPPKTAIKSELVSFPDTRLGKDAEKYPVTIDKYWTEERIKEVIANSNYKTAISKLAECESQFTAVKRLDSNGKFSYGLGQFQSSTWSTWEKEFNFEGDPMNAEDAVHMMEFALAKGYAFHWSCSKRMGLI